MDLKKMLVGFVDLKRKKPKLDIYANLGVVMPFTALTNSQFRNFIGDLSKNNLLNETEKEAINALWMTACPDIDGFGNNIWNLEIGTFVIYQKDDVKISFEKKASGIDSYTDEGRANFVYESVSGKFLINQNDRNKGIFLVFISEGMSSRLLQALKEVEVSSLKLKETILDETRELDELAHKGRGEK